MARSALSLAATAARDPANAALSVARRVGIQLGSRGLIGTHVLDRDWDVLVLLCSVDRQTAKGWGS